MKRKILVLAGGYSKERSVSLRSAKAIIKSINKLYKIQFCDPCHDFFKKIENFKPDVIFNALHGRFGEDGFIQTYLESKGLRYTHSGVLSSMMAMDKEISKKLFIKNKILTPKFQIIRTNLDKKEVLELLKKKI